MKKIIVLSIFFLISFNGLAQWKSPLKGGILAMSLSPDEQTIVIASPTWKLPQSTFLLVDIKSGKIKEILNQQNLISNPKFSRNGKRIFFTQNDISTYIVSCDLKGENLKNYGDGIEDGIILNSCLTKDNRFLYFAKNSFRKEERMIYRLYKMNLKKGEVSLIPGIEASEISGLSNYGNDLLFSKVQKYDGDSVDAKLFRLIPGKVDIVEEIVPGGEIKQFMWPKYHKKTNQLIMCRQSKFYKMDMDTKEVNLFCDLKDRRFMCYEISQKEELLYFFEIGGRKITVIDFEGNEIKSISLE